MAGKAKRAASAARNLGRRAAVGLKGTAISGATGGGTYFAHKYIAQKMPSMSKNPFVLPLVVIGLGHFIKRKNADVGNGMVGAGGYALGLAFDVNRANQQAAQQGGTGSDTRMVVDPSDVGMLLNPSDVRGELDIDQNYAPGLDISEAMNLGI